MSDDVELEEVVALRACRAELEHLQVEYDTLDAHHHRYATWAAREWLASEKRGDCYRARALALLKANRASRIEVRNQLTALKIGECREVAEALMEHIDFERTRAEAAEANAARLRALLELATNDQETYDYRRGYDSGYAAGQAAQRERDAAMCEERATMDDTDSDECRDCARAIRDANLPALVNGIALTDSDGKE